MGLFLQAVIVLLIGLITYYWYTINKCRKQLKWLPRVPGLPILGSILEFSNSTESLNVLKTYSEKHNGLFYTQLVSRFMIVAADTKFLEYILPSTEILDKSRDYQFLNQWLGDGILVSSGKRWKNTRRIITPGFHFSILEQFVETFDLNANRMVNRLEEVLNQDIDIFQYCTMCTLDIICETSMGISINAQKDPDSEYVFAIKEMGRITIARSFSPIKMFDLLYPLTKDYYKEKKCVKLLHSRTQDVIDKRKAELLKRKANNDGKKEEVNEVGMKKKMAFLDLILQGTMDGKPLSDQYIREEVSTLMFEGHDTTATAISYTLFCLANNPNVQQKVFEEQLNLFDNNLNQPVSHRLLQEMKYLELVIKESLRIYPPVPFYGRETHKDIVMKDGNVIPKGTTIMIFAYGVNIDPKVYPNPEKFDPDRWNNIEAKSPYSYLPFSAGPRNCIGQKFAILEMKSILSKIVRQFELLPTNPKHEMLLAVESLMKSLNGVKLKVKKRQL